MSDDSWQQQKCHDNAQMLLPTQTCGKFDDSGTAMRNKTGFSMWHVCKTGFSMWHVYKTGFSIWHVCKTGFSIWHIYI